MHTKKKLIHILGGGQWQLYTVKLAKALGYRVLVTDMYKQRPAYAYADAHEVIDITDVKNTLAAAKRHRIDGIICDTTDVGIPTMAFVAETLGLPGIGYETALNFTNKFRMREITSAAGVPNPPYKKVKTIEQLRSATKEIGMPLVIKPVDNQSSRGVHVLRTIEDIEPKYREAMTFARQGSLIAEGFLDGVETTVEGFCVDGEVFAAGISDKNHFAHRPEVANRLTYPPDLPLDVIERIREVNNTAVCSLGLRNGITHAEYIIVDNEPYLVEIAARGGGSHVYSHIVPYLAGANVPRYYLEYLLGGSFAARPDGISRAANLVFFDFPTGKVTKIEGVEEVRKQTYVEVLLLEFELGDVLRPPDDDRSRPGQVVIFGKTRHEVLEHMEWIQKKIKVQVQ